MNPWKKIIKYTAVCVVLGLGLANAAYAAVDYPQLDVQVVAGRAGSTLLPNASAPTSLTIEASVFSVILFAGPGGTFDIPAERFDLTSTCDGTPAGNCVGSLSVGDAGSTLTATFNNLVITDLFPPLRTVLVFSADLTYTGGALAGTLPKQGRIEGTIQPGSPQAIIAKVGPVKAALGDRVWLDNGDGIQDCADTNGNNILGDAGDIGPECLNAGKDGVKVNLIRDCGGENPTTTSTITAGGGFYLFTNLDPGTYCVEFETPAGFYCTIPNAGPGGKDPADSDGVDQLNVPNTCVTGPIVLVAGELDRTWDLGLVQQPLVSLGDRVWHDLDNDGDQDCSTPTGDKIGDGDDGCTEPGIPGVTVELYYGDCSTSTNMTDVTDLDGFYLFPDLQPGDYCVKFIKDNSLDCLAVIGDGVVIDLGDPLFTKKNTVGDSVDSDADPATGFSDPVNLVAGANLTVDAGIVCPAKIGDRVWLDLNGDGIQQCSDTNGDGHIGFGDTGTECGGIDPVTVTLYECGADGMPGGTGANADTLIGTRDTVDGLYMFGADGSNLPPGTYYVKFDKPSGLEYTIPEKPGDLLNSDCRTDGTSACVTVGSLGINLNRDCGLVEPECDLTLDKQCRLEPEPVTSGDCKGKLQQFTVKWDGAGSVSNFSITSGGGSGSHVSVSGGLVTVHGPFSSNDVVVSFTGGTKHKSLFHVSCSDADFNSADDCNKRAGDGKNKSGYDNEWLLQGFVDANGVVLDCNASSSGPFSQNCAFTKTDVPNCDTAGKPTTLTLRYTDGGCGDNSNTQDPSKTSCTGSVSGPVSIRASGKVDFSDRIYTVNPSTGVAVDGTFELSYGGSTFESDTFVELTDGSGTQLNRFHTSCSQDLVVGNVFGGLEVVAINGQSGGREVTYQYKVTNNGPALGSILLTDNVFGDIDTFALGAAPASKTIEVGPVLITGTTINTATAIVDGKACASDTVTVTVEEPVIPVNCSDIKNITAVSVIWDGPNGVDVVTESGEVFLDIQKGNRITFQEAGTGNDVELYLTGAASGTSVFHVSCSDANMNGTDDCGTAQGNGKDNVSGYINTWLLDGMTGQNGSFECGLTNTGVVNPETGGGGTPPPPPPPPPTGGDVTGASTLDLGDDRKAKWSLTNSGSQDVFITAVTVSWPSAHGQLKKFKLAGDFAKDVFDSTSPTSVPTDKAFESDPNKAKLKKGETRNLEIEFTTSYKGHSNSDFTITVTFDNGDVVTFP